MSYLFVIPERMHLIIDGASSLNLIMIGMLKKRSRICKLTKAAALIHECGCVASQIRLRESVIHVSF